MCLMLRSIRVFFVALIVFLCAGSAKADVETWALANPDVQEDFPAICLDRQGTPWVVYVEYNGKADVLRIARKTAEGLEPLGRLAGPGIIHQPALACDGKGTLWAVWSQVDKGNVMNLYARGIVDGKIGSDVIQLAGSPRGDVFADAGTDRHGRLWVTWQSFRNGAGDIYTRYYDPTENRWADEIRVTSHEAGDWEPRLAFGKDDETVIIFDSSRDDNFDIFLATVQPSGKTKLKQLTNSPRYEGRASIAATPDGKGYWVTWEVGRERWGKDSRAGGGGAKGLNQEKDLYVAYLDAATKKLTPAPSVKSLLSPLLIPKTQAVAKKASAKQQARRSAQKKTRTLQAVNLSQLVVDNQGNPWVTCRYCNGILWRIALAKYDIKSKNWSQPVSLENSSFGQDRRCNSVRGGENDLWFVWPSDKRTTKKAQVSGVYLARVKATVKPPAAAEPKHAAAKPKAERVPLFGGQTPDRPRSDRHLWRINGKKYGLYWGDFHRHTDVSNCRTPHDGCIVEQFRYAYDVAKLDFLGTSDHTDVGKMYDPYEWWCNQKLADVFQSPDFFNSFYVYEREQRWPWGHRNVIFSKRGGPLVYIKRALYKDSPWQSKLPVTDGEAEISPQELWQILRKNGMAVSIISHTGATSMGTNWDLYEQIDNAVENLVEIYQGCRVSYEGIGTPQPTVGLPRRAKPASGKEPGAGRDFGKYNKGVYQNALQNGYKLGVFASSDHISTHTTFGGVYTEAFSREGILEAMNTRRTIAATDKIFLEFSCNGRLLGSIFETDKKLTLKVAVSGTAKLKRITIVRNEADYKLFEPKGKKFTKTFTDPEPIEGENRYYIRVEQTDGNMAWSSPVWVTYKQ